MDFPRTAQRDKKAGSTFGQTSSQNVSHNQVGRFDLTIEKTAARPTLVDGVVLWPPSMRGRGRWRCPEEWERTFLPMSEMAGKTAREIVYAKRRYHRMGLRTQRWREKQMGMWRAAALRQASHTEGP